MRSIVAYALTAFYLAASVGAFSLSTSDTTQRGSRASSLAMSKGSAEKNRNIFDDLKGMFSNFDDVVDDFVMKRMGNGEQFYGKRKYNPSGNYDGDYNGMGQSSHYAIEISRVQKEVLEERKQRRLEEEAAARAGKTQ